MPYDANGVWSLTAGYLAVTGQVVSPTNHNPPLEDISTNGLSAVLVRDGRAPMTGNLNMGTTNKITNLANGTAAADGVNKSQLDLVGGSYAVKAGNYTALAADNNAVHRYTATATASLTAAATLGSNWRYTIISDGGTVTIDPAGAETINGLATLIVPNGSSAYIICDGTNFFTIIKPFAWEIAGATTDLSGLSTASWTDLGNYRDLRLRIFGTPSGTTGNIFFRVSSNNGSSYDSGATDYAHAFINAESTTIAAVAGVTAAQFNLMNVNFDAQPFEFNITFSEWNKAVVTLIDSKGFGFNATGAVQRNTNAFGRRVASTAFNALQLGISAGTFTRGMAIIEGIRG